MVTLKSEMIGAPRVQGMRVTYATEIFYVYEIGALKKKKCSKMHDEKFKAVICITLTLILLLLLSIYNVICLIMAVDNITASGKQTDSFQNYYAANKALFLDVTIML